MISTPTRPPRSYEEFGRDWPRFIRMVALGQGLPQSDVDDFVQDVCLYVYEHDSLSTFDARVAPFSAYLRGYIVKRCRSWWRTRSRQRYELTLDAPLSEDVDLTPGDRIADPLAEYILEKVLEKSRLDQFVEWLDAKGLTDLADTYSALVYQVLVAPNVDGKDTDMDMGGYTRLRWRVASDLGVSKTTVDSRMRHLRRYMEEFGLFTPA
jgi:DNA-directed RNA polymerase specialized sigma24 family protein